MVTHANLLTNIHDFNYWMPYREGAVYLHAAPIFHIADFPADVRSPGFRRLPGHDSQVQPAELLRDGRARSALLIPFWCRR